MTGSRRRLEALQAVAADTDGRQPLPVDLWNPPLSGDLDMRIARDGSWHYLGGEIHRPSMVQLFARLLRREPGGDYVLVTPVECWRITVEDVPFIAVDFELLEPGPAQTLRFTTNVGDRVVADDEHPLRMARYAASRSDAPYLRVRGGLDARVDRKSFYRLVEIFEEAGQGEMRGSGVRSRGTFFSLADSPLSTG